MEIFNFCAFLRSFSLRNKTQSRQHRDCVHGAAKFRWKMLDKKSLIFLLWVRKVSGVEKKDIARQQRDRVIKVLRSIFSCSRNLLVISIGCFAATSPERVLDSIVNISSRVHRRHSLCARATWKFHSSTAAAVARWLGKSFSLTFYFFITSRAAPKNT